MPYNGTGTYTPPAGDFPAVSSTVIASTKYNNLINDIASALTNAVTRDGQSPPTANLPMANFKHTGVSAAAASGQYARIDEILANSPRYGGTAGGTADALTLTITPTFAAYTAGMEFLFKSSASPNTGAATVNINSLGAKTVQRDGAALVAGDVAASKWYRIVYDGTNFQLDTAQTAPPKLTSYPVYTGATEQGALMSNASNALSLATSSSEAEQVRVTHTTSANRYITLTGSNGGNPAIGVSAGSLSLASAVSVTGALSPQALLDISASGAGQIKFPATQNASSDANTLDDYEEGTWTPTLLINGSSTGITYNTQIGRYTKWGRIMHIAFNIELASKGASAGAVTMTGEPYAMRSNIWSMGPIYWEVSLTSWINPMLLATFSGFLFYVAKAAVTTIPAMANTDVANTTKMFGSVVVETTA